MKKDDILELQRKVLGKIEMECKEDLMPALFNLADEDFPYDVLNLIVYDLGEKQSQCRGEFCFININEEEEIQTFTSIITMNDELDISNFGELCEAVNALNFYIPYGSFAISRADKNLIYKLSCPLPVDLSEELLHQQVELFISNAYLMVDKYIDLIESIATGENTLELIYDITGL